MVGVNPSAELGVQLLPLAVGDPAVRHLGHEGTSAHGMRSGVLQSLAQWNLYRRNRVRALSL